jgi:hypothetical protein
MRKARILAAMVGQSCPNQMKWLSGLALDQLGAPDGRRQGLGVRERYGAVLASGDHESRLADVGGDVRGGVQIVHEAAARPHAGEQGDQRGAVRCGATGRRSRRIAQ